MYWSRYKDWDLGRRGGYVTYVILKKIGGRDSSWGLEEVQVSGHAREAHVARSCRELLGTAGTR